MSLEEYYPSEDWLSLKNIQNHSIQSENHSGRENVNAIQDGTKNEERKWILYEMKRVVSSALSHLKLEFLFSQ